MQEHDQLVIFKLGSESYGVSINEVMEIIEMEELSSISKAPKYVEGLLNIRGDIYVVFNMRKKFDIDGTQLENSKIIIVKNRKIGFIVDEVSEIIEVEEKYMETRVEMPFDTGGNYIDGIAKVNGKIIIELNICNILSIQEEQEVELVTTNI